MSKEFEGLKAEVIAEIKANPHKYPSVCKMMVGKIERLETELAAAESRGIARGKAEMLRWLRANWSADWGKTICDMEDAILSAPQPQEIAGERCVWMIREGCWRSSCHVIATHRPSDLNCPKCRKPIVTGGER